MQQQETEEQKHLRRIGHPEWNYSNFFLRLSVNGRDLFGISQWGNDDWSLFCYICSYSYIQYKTQQEAKDVAMEIVMSGEPIEETWKLMNKN